MRIPKQRALIRQREATNLGPEKSICHGKRDLRAVEGNRACGDVWESGQEGLFKTVFKESLTFEGMHCSRA